uniref:TIGR03915 family putative DNA repair protein n=1 Tax=uncultured Ruthenibacterium sp. TaxID=1905347 RepID=UPI00349E7FD8
RVLFMPGHEDVHPMLAAQLFLKNEAHRFVEFIRFSDHGGVLTACISPKSFVLPYIQNHFCDRYSIETFLIYDRTHHAALIWKEKRASIVPLDNFEPPPPDSNEQQYRILWKRFYDTIAIPDRENPRCRMNHCPKRYWPDMLEMSADVPKFVASDSPALKK